MTINFRIPTIEQIYNEYHKQTFYYMNGFYPKTITTFKALNDTKKVEYLKRFQQVLKRNRQTIDWKIYIKSLAYVFKDRFDLKLLGSLGGNKIYRNYVKGLFLSKDSEQEIYSDIINSLLFLTSFLKENNITFEEYFKIENNILPLALKHIYAGTISIYFYACFEKNKLWNYFDYLDDVFLELFQLNKYQFFEKFIDYKRKNILKFPKILKLIQKIQKI